MNKVIITGRLTRDPELKNLSSDMNLCNFSVAVDRPYVKEGDVKVDFFDCVAFRKQADFVFRYFTKGKPIMVTGRLQNRDWTDKAGAKRRSTEIVVDEIEFCGGDKFDRNQQAQAPAAPPAMQEMPGGDPFENTDDDGELPF